MALVIESGSHAPGVSGAKFGLLPGEGLRIERPADELRHLVPTYMVYDSDPLLWRGSRNWLLPGGARIWISGAAGPLHMVRGNRRYALSGGAMLHGPSSRALSVTSHGGSSVAFDIGALGWARLFAPSAETIRDRLVPLEQLLPPAWVEELVARVGGPIRGPEVKCLLDEFLTRIMPPPHPDEALIRKTAQVFRDPATTDVADAAARIGIDARALAELTRRFFGFPPKILLMRKRFLRALTGLLVDGRGPDDVGTPAGYHDASHFIRDGNRFLGMTPRRFLALDQPYLRTMLRVRALVTGAALPSLDRLP